MDLSSGAVSGFGQVVNSAALNWPCTVLKTAPSGLISSFDDKPKGEVSRQCIPSA